MLKKIFCRKKKANKCMVSLEVKSGFIHFDKAGTISTGNTPVFLEIEEFITVSPNQFALVGKDAPLLQTVQQLYPSEVVMMNIYKPTKTGAVITMRKVIDWVALPETQFKNIYPVNGW